MEKKEITILPKKDVVFDFGNMTDIRVSSFLSVDVKRQIAEAYLSAFFNIDDSEGLSLNELMAEYALVLSIVDLCTNLSVDFSGSFEKFDNLIGSGLWEKIESSISNYDEFRSQLNNMVKHIREDVALEKSVGSVLEKLVGIVNEGIKKISELDISSEKIADLLKPIDEKIGEIQNISKEIPVKKQRQKRPTSKETK